MEKKITVYVVKTAGSSVSFATAARARAAQELLTAFAIEAVVEKEIRVVTL